MKLRNSLIILTSAVALSGCSSGGTSYGIPSDKWSAMSYSQQQSARELYELENVRQQEIEKLNAMRARKADADMQRQREANQEQVQIDQQQKKVDNIRIREQYKQTQRERELDSLKDSSVKPSRTH